eukprot:TRINITY_DN421_c0_g1_i1.p1 TRINITY_DN421_c0_g1~~TRINITY_DN421_c0_g1_i1.p1  ORF type:complete len:327 (+),score=67.36 TRINITY_DN421_c0_g1_i1:43-1023(+)
MNLQSLFSGLKVGDLFPQKKEIISFPHTTKVSEFLTKLESASILSAPILDDDQKTIGIVDVLDIVLFIIGLFPKEVPWDNLDENELRKVLQSGSQFDNTPISELLELSHRIKQQYGHLITVTKSTPITKLLDMFYLGIHRVLVLDDKGVVENVISQSDLLHILGQCLPFLEERERKILVKDFGLSSELTTVKMDTKTIQVLSMMQTNIDLPILSAVPIVDIDGNLVANFSASNLKGLRQTTFISLLLPVMTFLTIQQETEDFQTNLTRFKSVHPIVCDMDTTFECVVERMVAHRIHRLWIVQDKRPIGVISIGDVFRLLLPWTDKK